MRPLLISRAQKMAENNACLSPIDTSIVLQLTGVTREFTRRKRKFAAVDRVTLTLHSGEFAAIVGKSGNGKSTLLNMIAALLQVTHGSLSVCGMSLTDSYVPDRQLALLRARDLGFVTQSQTLLANLNVLNNILLPTQIMRSLAEHDTHSTVVRDMVGKVLAEEFDTQHGDELRGGVRDETGSYEQRSYDELCVERAVALAKYLGVDDLLWCYPKELSGGEMRRVMIARALMNNPRLLILDEPTGDLDSHHTALVMKLLKRLSEQSMAVLMVTHDRLAAAYADVMYCMDRGVLTQDFRTDV